VASDVLTRIAEDFSPRYECTPADVLIDVDTLRHLFADAHAIGTALQETASSLGVPASLAIARTLTAARILAHAHAGTTVVDDGSIAGDVLAPLPLALLAHLGSASDADDHTQLLRTFTRWGLTTLGDLARLPAADLRARVGPRGAAWQAMARGEDTRPLRPTRPEERFEGTLELDWPIEGLEPLSFALTRVLEPLSVQLERRDRGVATLHLALHLVTRDVHWRHLELPAPMRDVRTLRTLLLLDIETHPPAGAIDEIRLFIDPTPARIVQHTLFSRPQPAPEQVSTLLARLHALLGSDRVGSPALTDTDRAGAFALQPFRTVWPSTKTAPTDASVAQVVMALRRYRPPVAIRVAVDESGVPVRITVDRAGLESGPVAVCAGPWKTSGDWWNAERWDHDEWDAQLESGPLYRLARDRRTGHWFLHAVAD
jgi:protein ImuB